MMKHNLLTRLAMILLTVGLTAGFARAQEGKPPGEGEKKPQTPPVRRANQTENLISRLKKAIKPMGKQLPQLEQIWKTYRQSVRNWKRENDVKLKVAQEKLREVRKSGDKKTTNAVTKEIRAIQTSRGELTKNLQQQLSGVLTKEQMGRVRAVLRVRGKVDPKAMLGRLDLTEQQKVKIKIILDDATAQGKKTDSEAIKKQLLADAYEKIRLTVLTPEQNEKFKSMLRQRQPTGRRVAQRPQPPAEQNLTDEQKGKEKEIMDVARNEAAKTEGRRARRRILAAAQREVRQEVWTEEQRTQARQRRVQRGRERMERMGLSDDQITQAEEIMDEARKESAEAENRQERRQIMRAAFNKVRQEVWTEEQRTQTRERMVQRGRERMKQMGLSDDQITQTETIMDEARTESAEVESGEERRNIWRAAFEKVRQEVWTDEQRKRFEQRRNQRRGGRNQGGGGGGG